MAQGEFTKEEAKETAEAVEEMFNAIPKTKRGEYIGHLNDILLFIAVAGRNAPHEHSQKPPNKAVARDAESSFFDETPGA